MMIYSWDKRPLKRPRLGPPDVYPQDPKQREDELTAVNVKQGFSHIPQLSDEFGSAKNANISAAKLGAFINGVNTKKGENSSLPDTGKKRLQVNTKDHFWHVTPRMKSTLEVWMTDLAGGKSLAAIAKKVPIFNKREEIFLTLAEHQVPMVRAAWFLKMTASYNSAMSEAKTKKRQMPDPSQEWTISLQRCCKDIFLRLTEWYNGGSGAALTTSINAAIPPGPGPHPSSTGTNLGSGSSPSVHQNSPNSTSSINQAPGTPNSATMNGTSTPAAAGQTQNQGDLSPSSSNSDDDGAGILKQWQYCTELAKFLCEEGLLDRYEWLLWVIDMCDKTKSIDDYAWQPLLPLLLSYLPDIAQSELLSRRIATSAARKLSAMFTDQDFILLSPLGGNPPSPPIGVTERLQCETHRSTIFGLSSVIQVISLECPTSLVYNANQAAINNESGRNSVPGGSALDILPIQPSLLPMPPRSNNHIIRGQLREAECQIIARSRAVEAKWSCEEWQQSSAGTTLQKVLAVLDALDRHSFDKVEAGSSLETLYSKIFPYPPNKDNPVEADAPVVILLCQWAVCSQRTGEHRALAVARLLEQRQTETTSSNDGEPPILEGQMIGLEGTASEGSKSEGTPLNEDVPMNGNGNESETGGSGDTNGNGSGSGNASNNGGNGAESEDSVDGYTQPIYHNLLFKFLDTDAPVLDENSPRSKITFSSLVNLFGALIRHDIFSHDSYLCALVARGDLSTVPQSLSMSSASSMPPTSVQPINSVATPGPASQAGPNTPASVSSVTPGTTPHHDLVDDRGPLFPPLPRLPDTHNNRQTDYSDDRNIDDDLDMILQRITQEQQNSMDQVDSPKDDTVVGVPGFGSVTPNPTQSNAATPMIADANIKSASGTVGGSSSTSGSSTTPNLEVSKQSRHRLYVTHFPLPQDENYQHEINQRHILLYGCGRARDEARHMVKKVSKELGKMFSKKFCFDVSDGSRVKKQSKNEINFEQLQTRFATLPYFDQHAVTSAAAQTALEMLAAFGTGRGSYLPTVEHVAYLTELMEASQHIVGLIEMSINMLRELPDIESQLCARVSPIAATYTTSLQLQLVAVLRRYHCSLLLDTESTNLAWDNLIRLMRRLTSNVECTSAERCTLAYLTELQACCGFLRSKNLADYLTPTAAKLRQYLCTPVQPAESSHEWNNAFMTTCLDNPKRKVDNSVIRQLLENPNCRYSFVCNAILSICNEADADRLNDLASLCADMTAACPPLASEWLGVLQTLCSPSRDCVSYADILSELDIKHLSIHSSLATLTALLVARQCFSLQDFVMQAMPSLLKAWNEGEWGRGPHDPDTEAGARLTCHLLLSLFKIQDAVTTVGNPGVLRLSCDRRLLSATHSSVTLGAVLAALKAMLLLADAAGTGERRRDQRLPGMAGELSISHILGTSDVPSERNNPSDAIRGEPRTLASFAFSALQQMCGELWVRQRCLQNPDDLCNQEMLLDTTLSPKQAQRLLYMICYPELPVPEESLDARTHIPKILEGLNQWNIREAWLALTLQNKQLNSSPVEYQTWLDIVARAALDVFHLGSEDGQEFVIPSSAAPSPAPGKSPRSGKKTQQNQVVEQIAKTPPSSFNTGSGSSQSTAAGLNVTVNGIDGNKDAANNDGDGTNGTLGDHGNYGWIANAQWLIAPLVAKLSSFVQGRVLRHAGTVLENTLWPKNYGKSKNSTSPTISSAVGSSSLHAHLPFLALVLTCLRGQDEQREGLLASLLNQFTQLLSYAKDRDFDLRSNVLRDAIRLRLSLVGGMFDVVQRSSTATAEWAVVLTQLVTHGVVDINNNSDLFPTIVDMVTALVHSTQIAEPGDRVEEMKKQNMNLVKKLKKELADRDVPSIKPLRQLLPFSKVQTDVLVTQATSMIIDSKGNRVPSFEFVDKKPGLQVWEKQRVSPWEIIECQRNPAPLSWAWFGAVKMERKNLRYEETHRYLKYHNHSLVKPSSHFLEPVPLPPEEIDVKPEIKEEIIKPDTPSSDQSPRTIGPPLLGRNNKPPKAPRKRRSAKQTAQQSQQPALTHTAVAAAAAAVIAQSQQQHQAQQAAQQQAQQQAAQQQAQQQAQQVQQQQQQQSQPQQQPPSQPPPPTISQAQPPPPLPTVSNAPTPFSGPQMTNQLPPGPGPNQAPPPPNYTPTPTSQWNYSGQQQQPPQQPFFPNQQQVPAGIGRPQIPQHLKNSLIVRTRHTPNTPTTPGATNQFQQFPQGPPTGPPGAGPRHQNILRQQLRGQAPTSGPLQNQGFQGQPVMQPNQGVMFQQQQVPGQGMNQNYGYNQSSMGSQGQPVSGAGPQGGGGPGPGMMSSQQQQMNSMMSQRGPVPVQEMGGFMPGGPQGAGQIRGMGQRPPAFMQGNPQTGPGNPMNPMQTGYRRPPMGQMVQPGQLGGPGQMGPGPQGSGQMGQPVHGQMVQGMQNPGQMVQGGMGGPGMNPNMVQQGGQMGQPGMQNPGMVSDQRMRQFAAMQQQQNHQQQQQGMGMGPRMHFQNQQGSFQ